MPIYLRIGVCGKRTEISTGKTCNPSNWNPNSHRCKGTREEAKLLNAYLDSLQTKLNVSHQLLVEAGKEITVEKLRNSLTGKKKNRGCFWIFSKPIMKE